MQARQIVNPPAGMLDEATNFVEELQAQKKKQESSPDFFDKILFSRLLKIAYFDKIALNVVPLLLYKAKMLNEYPLESKVNFLKDLNSTAPSSVFGAFQFSDPVLIRSVGQASLKR